MITTHVLDTALGRPARGVPVELERAGSQSLFSGSGEWEMVGGGVTDADGRQRELTKGPVEPGTYRIRFQTGTYFDSINTRGFYPVVEIQFTIEDAGQHYHVPLLLSPYGYSTYRGS